MRFFIYRVQYEDLDSFLQSLELIDEPQGLIQPLLEDVSRTRFLMRIVEILEPCQVRLESSAFLN